MESSSESGAAEEGAPAAETSQLASMKAVFDIFDASGEGKLQPYEIGQKLRELNLVKSRRQIKAIVEIVDVNGDGEIDFEEFVALMGRVKAEAQIASDDAASDATGDELAALQQTKEERQAKADRQGALFAFQRAVTMIALTELAKDDDKLMAELLDVLSVDPTQRSEWDLQRLLIWAETYDPEKKGADVGFKFILDLPPPEESNVRIEVCRCMTVQRFDEGQTICKQGEEGDCMYVIMLGEVDILIMSDGQEKQVACFGPGRSVGELAVIGEEESDTLRTATLRAHVPCVLGVLSRADYRRHILRMEQEAKAPLVEKLMKVEYLRRISPSGLLRLAMMMKPVRFSRGEAICMQGVVPGSVTFITSGSAMVTVHVDDGGQSKAVDIMEQGFDSSLEGIGVSMVGDDPEPNRWSLRATTLCEGVSVSLNIARRTLNRRHVQETYKEHLEAIDRVIARRVIEQTAGDRARESLGFPSSGRRKGVASGRKSGRRSNNSQAASTPQTVQTMFGVRLPGSNVTPRSLLQPGQAERSYRNPMPPSGSVKAASMPPVKLLGRAAAASPRHRATVAHASPIVRKRESQAVARGATTTTPRMPTATHGPHAARSHALRSATTGRLAA
jgi:CRP-like cAMP-binding protein